MDETDGRPQVDRRTVVRGAMAAAAGLALAGCSTGTDGRAVPTGSATTSGGPPTSPPAPAPPGTAGPSGTSDPVPRPEPAVLRQAGPDIATGPGTSALVALTFHGAGEVAITTKVLAVLAGAGATVTVFAVGQWLDANPALGREIVAAGHDLGNHTWSHQQMKTLTAAQARDEIRRGAEAVARSVGSAGLLFRPSGTPSSTDTIRAAAAASGYPRCISYDVDPEDFLDPGPSLVTSRTLAKVRNGSIVSLHLGHQGTLDALPRILEGLAGKGLGTASVTGLLRGT